MLKKYFFISIMLLVLQGHCIFSANSESVEFPAGPGASPASVDANREGIDSPKESLDSPIDSAPSTDPASPPMRSIDGSSDNLPQTSPLSISSEHSSDSPVTQLLRHPTNTKEQLKNIIAQGIRRMKFTLDQEPEEGESGSEEGSESRLTTRAREIRLAQELQIMRQALSDTDFALTHQAHKSLSTTYLRNAKQLREKARDKLIQTTIAWSSTEAMEVNMEALHETISTIEKIVADYNCEADSLEIIEAFPDATIFFQALEKELPSMAHRFEQAKAGRVFTAAEMAELQDHLKKITKFRTMLGKITRKIKHTSWAAFAAMNGTAELAHAGVLGTGIATTTAVVAAPAAKALIIIAMAASLAYKLHKTYHKIVIVQGLTGQSLRQSTLLVINDDLTSIGKTVEKIKYKLTPDSKTMEEALTIIKGRCDRFTIFIQEQMSRMKAKTWDRKNKDHSSHIPQWDVVTY